MGRSTYEARGKVIDLVTNTTFDGRAGIRALFNKDVLLRDGRGSSR